MQYVHHITLSDSVRISLLVSHACKLNFTLDSLFFFIFYKTRFRLSSDVCMCVCVWGSSCLSLCIHIYFLLRRNMWFYKTSATITFDHVLAKITWCCSRSRGNCSLEKLCIVYIWLCVCLCSAYMSIYMFICVRVYTCMDLSLCMCVFLPVCVLRSTLTPLLIPFHLLHPSTYLFNVFSLLSQVHIWPPKASN